LLILPLHLLHLLQALLLHELHALLGCHGGLRILRLLRLRLGRLKDLRLLFRLIVVGFHNGIIIGLLVWRVGGRILVGRRSIAPDSQDHGSRGSLAFIAEHQVVVAGTVQKLGENIFRLPGPIIAKHTLVFAEAFDLCAGLRGDLVENLAQVRVRCLNVQSFAVPGDGGLFGGFVRGPFGRFGSLRRRGCSFRGSGHGGVTGARTGRFSGMGGRLRGGEGAGHQQGEAGKAQCTRSAAPSRVSHRIVLRIPHKDEVCSGPESPRLSMY
jgi:hypothetical protein